MTSTILQPSEAGPEIAIHQAGAGYPVVLIHGVGLNSEAWAPVISRLKDALSVSAIDLPGHGASAGLPKSAPSLGDYTDAIASAVQSTEHPALIVGHSLGALIALDLAIRYRELASGVIALNCIFRRTPEAAKAVRKRASEIASSHPPDPEPTLERWFGDNPEGELKQVAAGCRDLLTSVQPAEYGKAYSVFARENGPSDHDLEQLQSPALFMTGVLEPNSTPEMSHALADAVPDGTCVILEGARHMMPMTHAEKVAAEIANFVRERLGNHADA